LINNIVNNLHLTRCDDLYPLQKTPTYVNLALGHDNQIDFILTANANSVTDFQTLDPDVNFSDHLPLLARLQLSDTTCKTSTISSPKHTNSSLTQLRWDKADKYSYYQYTGYHLLPLNDDITNLSHAYKAGTVSADCVRQCIDSAYVSLVSVLRSAADMYVPNCRKNFFKFWWDEDLSLLKQASIDSDRAWKDAGKPRNGPIFANRQSSRMQYRQRLRQSHRMDVEIYSNDLHEALLKKNGTAFWRCWHSKFETRNKCTQVDGCADNDVIAGKFSSYFANSFSGNTPQKAESLREEFANKYSNYCGLPITDDHNINTELVSTIIGNFKHGKAPDIDGLSAEHLYFCHPSISTILANLFQLMLLLSFIPAVFRYNYIVPIPKPKEYHSISLTCNDFRAIAISPIISKVFENCIIDRFGSFFTTSDNQFGFKKGLGCNYAIRAVRNIVDGYIKGGRTANLCAIDLSKAFDKVNHHALFIKLMKRLIPNHLLDLLVSWLSECYSYVKWYDSWSDMFSVHFGVRQGSSLSPYLFAVYVDDLAKLCLYKRGVYIVLYADDILLLAPSVCELHNLLASCEVELDLIDMAINIKKSCCVRIGPRSHVCCASISCASGISLPWVGEIRYLGIFIVRSRVFKCSLDHPKKGFYRSANAIFGKVGRIASEEVVLQLLNSKCIPVLLYGLEACPLLKSDLASVDFVIVRFLMKLFNTNNMDIINNCQQYFDVKLPSTLWSDRVRRFEKKFAECDNIFCKISVSVR